MVTLAANSVHAKFFMNKRFFLHVRGRVNTNRAADLIKAFGGQIDEFLECGVSYVLTDVVKSDWPPKGSDETLKKALESGVKLMSFHDLLAWCSKYLTSQSSSDEDEEIKAHISHLQRPYIKFEPERGNYAPVARELKYLPELNYEPKMGSPIFLDPSPPNNTSNVSVNTTNNLLNNSAQLTPQAISSKNYHMTHISITPSVKSANRNAQAMTPQSKLMPNLQAPLKQPPNSAPPVKQLRRKHPAYCEICNQKSIVDIREHCQSTNHLENLKKLDWTVVKEVIKLVPKMESLGCERTIQIPSESTKNYEFLCLHNLESPESVSQWLNPIN